MSQQDSSLSRSELEMAKRVVRQRLKLDAIPSSDLVQCQHENEAPFIARHKEEIFEKLEHIYDSDREHEFAFIAASLPLISGIIHVGSRVNDYKEATKWVAEEANMPNADPASVLSALTFIYIVDKGVNDPIIIEIKDRKLKWENMQKLVNRVLSQEN